MKNKTSIIIASFIFIVTLVINVQSKTELSRLSELTISSINQAFAVDPEYPHYGNYGRDLFDCSYTATATANGSVTYKGITIPVTANVEFTISCTNCAWDCNADGANTTCDPESC
jgi:hypothetical protein